MNVKIQLAYQLYFSGESNISANMSTLFLDVVFMHCRL